MVQLEAEPVIVTVADGNQLLDIGARGIGSQVVQSRKRDVDGGCRSETVEIYQRDGNTKLRRFADGVGICRVVRSQHKPHQLARG